MAILAPILAPYPPLRTATGMPLEAPSWAHPLGTDDLGRDVLSGLLFGARVTLLVGFLSAATSVVIGASIGAVAGYLGGKPDSLLMRITEFFQVVPRLFLAILMVSFFGPQAWIIIAVIGGISWPETARVVRAQFLTLRETSFVLSAVAVGAPSWRVIGRHILPNSLPPIVVAGSLQVGSAILLEAGLSFIGLGDPDAASWGVMLQNAQGFMELAWWMVAFPGAAILTVVLSVNLLGDALSERVTPWLR